MKLVFSVVLLLAISFTNLSYCQFVSDDDVSTASSLKKKFKSDAYAALSMKEHYTFQRGKNEFQQPAVTVKEEGSVEFIALKDIAIFQFSKFHNRFVKLNAFLRYDKYQKKYTQSERKGIDQPVTDDNIFFDDENILKYFLKM